MSGCGERGFQVFENGFGVVRDAAGFAVHEMRSSNDVAAISSAKRLVSEADTQDGQLSGEMPKDINADAGFLRRAWTRRNYDAFRVHLLDFLDGNLIVPANHHIRAQFTQILHQVIGKRIVVIEDKNHGR